MHPPYLLLELDASLIDPLEREQLGAIVSLLIDERVP
jgi:hypothetical protein